MEIYFSIGTICLDIENPFFNIILQMVIKNNSIKGPCIYPFKVKIVLLYFLIWLKH